MKQARIFQLSTQVANQIAAGEVVERPFSVVKELLENAIDANATKIDIDIEGAGLHLIRIRDNGDGIHKDDLALAFAPHATSKIRTQNDLEAISSMGFRGEALASIASISRCRLMSKPALQDKAWQIQNPQLNAAITPVAHPNGTTIEVEDLFFNTPVRRKFLRSEKTEFQAIEEMVKRVALAFTHVNITLKHQQKVVRHFPAVKGDLSNRVAKICGQQFVNNAAYVSMQAGTMRLEGWLGFPDFGKRTADCQYFFVNQRMIKDRLINHVIKTLYSESAKMVLGTYPCFVLYLTIDPTEVDVNVHPTKQEVRFANATMVHDFLSKCVRDTLFAMTNETKNHAPTPATFAPSSHQSSHVMPGATRYFGGGGALKALYEANSVTRTYQDENVKVGRRYAFLEDEQGVIIIDLEKSKFSITRFYFEHSEMITSKPLLFPQYLTLKQPPKENRVHHLLQYGFVVVMEKNELKVLRQPDILSTPIDTQILQDWIVHDSVSNLAKSLSKLPLNFNDKELLLTKWVNTRPTEGVIRLSHALMETFNAVTDPTI